LRQKRHLVADQLLVHRLQMLHHQPHQDVYFMRRPVPILGRKRIEREVRNPQAHALGNDVVHPARTFSVAPRPPAAGELRPTSIAIHDDGQMADRGERAFHQIVMTSLDLDSTSLSISWTKWSVSF